MCGEYMKILNVGSGNGIFGIIEGWILNDIYDLNWLFVFFWKKFVLRVVLIILMYKWMIWLLFRFVMFFSLRFICVISFLSVFLLLGFLIENFLVNKLMICEVICG